MYSLQFVPPLQRHWKMSCALARPTRGGAFPNLCVSGASLCSSLCLIGLTLGHIFFNHPYCTNGSFGPHHLCYKSLLLSFILSFHTCNIFIVQQVSGLGPFLHTQSTPTLFLLYANRGLSWSHALGVTSLLPWETPPCMVCVSVSHVALKFLFKDVVHFCDLALRSYITKIAWSTSLI